MSDSYLVPAGFGEAVLIEKKSRFIARVWRTDTEAEALDCLQKTREQHRDATHNVYAYIIRENSLTRYSDDGEPSGTSGMPTLNVFSGEQIQNVCCVVTRYFGGTLLGTGGLARAYSGAAKLALEAAGVARMAPWHTYALDCDYSFFEIAKRVCDDFGAVIRSSDFGESVTMLVAVAEDVALLFEKSVADCSAGKVKCRFLSSEFIGVKIPFGGTN